MWQVDLEIGCAMLYGIHGYVILTSVHAHCQRRRGCERWENVVGFRWRSGQLYAPCVMAKGKIDVSLFCGCLIPPRAPTASTRRAGSRIRVCS